MPRLPLLAVLLTVCLGGPARAEEDPLAEAKSLVELGTTYVEIGADRDDVKKIAQGVAKYRRALRLFEEALEKPDLTPAQKNRIKSHIVDVESRIEWHAGPTSAVQVAKDAVATGAVRVPDLEKGERVGPWCRRVRKLYEKTDDPLAQAALARGMASNGGVLALPVLLDLFEKEEGAQARKGVHEALAMVGTERVAKAMRGYARKNAEAHWEHALDVVYLCLDKSDRIEPEQPFLRAVRKFHELKDRKLTLGILRALDAMVPSGTAALGEVLFVDDFGYHDHAIDLLARKRDRRAVPPLVHKMDRFKFEQRVQLPAHEALLRMGWYAVPELIDRLDDRAAGTWISWTLRKITGETMGTDKRKWGDWWKTERLRHPELFDDPAERPESPPAVTGSGGK